MTPSRIRKAEREDIPALIALLGQLFAIEKDFHFCAERQRRGLEHLLACRTATVLTALCNGRVAGMVSGQILISTAEGGPSLLAEDLVVDDSMRGRGIGSLLLFHIGRWGREHRAGRMQLLADIDNLKGLGFYHSRGWSRTNLVCLRKYNREHDNDTDADS